MSLNTNLILRGTDGRVWFNGEILAEIKSFESKAAVNKNEIFVNGDYTAKHLYLGNSISGTMTAYKVDSKVLNMYKDALASGVMPELTLVGMNQNPSNGKKERVALYGVILDEVSLIKFENNTSLEVDHPFTADSYKVLEAM